MILPDAPVVLACGVVLDLYLNLHLVKCSWEYFKSHASCKKKNTLYVFDNALFPFTSNKGYIDYPSKRKSVPPRTSV